MSNPLNVAELDPGIADLVILLNEDGFETFTSCEGGPGHAFSMPTIRIRVDPARLVEEEKRLAKTLIEAGYGGFYTKIVNLYQGDVKPWQPGVGSFLEVEFWFIRTIEYDRREPTIALRLEPMKPIFKDYDLQYSGDVRIRTPELSATTGGTLMVGENDI